MSGSYLLFGSNAAPPAAPMAKLRSAGHIFEADGVPWRYRGFSFFMGAELARQGRYDEIDAICDDYAGFTVARVWDYVPWVLNGWTSPGATIWLAFLAHLRARGLRVELTLLTDDDPYRVGPAIQLVNVLAAAKVDNLLVEIGNEPETHKWIDTTRLQPVCAASGFPWSSGHYENSWNWRGTYGTAHTARTFDYARRAHDLMEYYNGGGPNAPSDPPCRAPWVADEPMKLQDVPGTLAEKVRGWRGYFGAASLMGAGATFHGETGKFGQRPTPDERLLMAAALDGLNAFPADAPNGAYRRIDEPGAPEGARTYVVGTCMVRCQQPGTVAPESGWTPLDADGVLWQR